MPDDIKYCSSCGLPIYHDWVTDTKSDREDPHFLHLGCGLDNNQGVALETNYQSRPVGEVGEDPLQMPLLWQGQD